MGRRLLLRPLPLFLVFVFGAVAVVDLVHTLSNDALPPPVVLQPGAVEFEAWEPVIDLRSDGQVRDIGFLPAPVLAGGLWSEADAAGTWILGHGAELALDLVRGGQRVVVFEGRPAAGKRPVRAVGISVNGVDCGTAKLHQGWQRWSVAVPEGGLRDGLNSIVFRVPDRASVRRPRRALQLRRVELRFDLALDTGASSQEPLDIDFEAQRILMRTPGVLEARFMVDDRVDALRMRYRFRSPEGTVEMTVARPQGGGVGRDAEIRQVLSASAQGVERIRVPLHGRRGEFVLRLAAEPWEGQALFDIRSVELVTERNRSGFGDGHRR
ncbi:MAG: hypothetical protein QNL88_16550 [Acidobacteriota bacterium]|nr:hypothetical protein [Acidobacteriota bacterium]